jgi:hypothetical protein
MCDQPSTSAEHVPPKCLFPKQRDLPAGVDLRRKLITVPSCDAHNGAKSADDLFLQYVLVMNLPANTIAKNHFAAAVWRRFLEHPALMTGMVKQYTPVVAVDTVTGEQHRTIAIDIDRPRLDRALTQVAYGLYFHHFEKPWAGTIEVHPEFLLSTLDPAQAAELNAPVAMLASTMNSAFAGLESHGENPDVFCYQFTHGVPNVPLIMRLHFYGDVKVTLLFRA